MNEVYILLETNEL